MRMIKEAAANMATSRDIAALAGVSQSTVSRVLRGDLRVGSEARERVLEISREMGYSPNLLARSMRTKRTGCVSLVIADITNPLFSQIVQAVESALADDGLTLVLWDEDASDTHAMEDTRLSLVDGVIFAAALPGSRIVNAATRNRVPIVLINRTLPGLDSDCVIGDDYAGGRLAAEHLIESGRTNLALLSGPDAASTSRERARGFREALRDAAIGLPSHWDQSGDITHSFGREATIEMMRGTRRPDGLFCISDLIALGAIDGCVSQGISVPEDVHVVGFNNIAIASWDSYSLTTISHPIEQMAKEALVLLRRRIGNPEAPPATITLGNKLIVRNSTGQNVSQTNNPLHE